MGKYAPVEINHVKAQRLVRITWDDDHVGDYPLEHLRGYCPCALCQGHDAALGKKFIAVPGVGLQDIQPVGNYAVEFHWQDGHSTGIYSYDYLRSLCPCAACGSEQPTG